MVAQEQIQRTGPNVSIVIPVYNGEQYIEASIERIKRIMSHFTEEYEILVVNDGSIDNTRSVVNNVYPADRRVRLISYKPNMDKGYAVKQGVLSAEGKNILYIDGDGNINPHVITSCLNELKSADIIIGSKHHHDSKVKVPMIRKLLSLGFHLLVNPILNMKINDTQVGLKAGKAEAFKKIFTRVLVNKYAFDVEMLAVGNLLGLRIVEMPVQLEINRSFKIKDVVRMFIDILGISYRLRVLKWYQRNMDIETPGYKPLFAL